MGNKSSSHQRQRGQASPAIVSEDTGENWAFLIFLVFLLSLVGLALWLSFPKPMKTHSPAPFQSPAMPAEWGFNEPIQPIPFATNIDPKRAALGQRLFYDPQLSGDNTLSCNSCHDLDKGGADDKIYSLGVGAAVGQINTPTVFNAVNNIAWFWDGRATTLEDQLDGPILRPDEMDSDWETILQKLSRDKSYVADFSAAYDDGLTIDNIKNALVTFERTLVTPDSPFDRYLRGDYYAIDEEEKRGYQLFKDYGCSSCHQGVNVGGNLFQVFGVVANYFDGRSNITKADLGRFNVTGREVDRHRFRVPSLRNIALTAPYFHDGSASRLEDAVYTMAEYQLGRNISAEDVGLIIRFLHTLTGVNGEQK